MRTRRTLRWAATAGLPHGGGGDGGVGREREGKVAEMGSPSELDWLTHVTAPFGEGEARLEIQNAGSEERMRTRDGAFRSLHDDEVDEDVHEVWS